MIALLAALALIASSPVATYTWDAPSVGEPDHYIVLVSQSGYDDELYTTTQNTISIDVTPGREIRMRVAACAGGFCGAWSRISSGISLNLSADFNEDGAVGLTDYFMLHQQIGGSGAFDLTGDGAIGLVDLLALNDRIGDCIGPVSVNGQTAEAYLPCDLVFP